MYTTVRFFNTTLNRHYFWDQSTLWIIRMVSSIFYASLIVRVKGTVWRKYSFWKHIQTNLYIISYMKNCLLFKYCIVFINFMNKCYIHRLKDILWIKCTYFEIHDMHNYTCTLTNEWLKHHFSSYSDMYYV